MITKQEHHQLLVDWNSTATEYPNSQCIHQLFESQVKLTPDAVAVVFEEQQLTYQELNDRANQLAHYLQGLGVEPEVLVGLCIERSLDMVIAMLGILKAGGAYVPLDPAYPAERLSFMVEDAQLSIVVTQQSLAVERRQEAGGRRQEAGGRSQEAEGRRQEAGGSSDEKNFTTIHENFFLRVPASPRPRVSASLSSQKALTLVCLDRDWESISQQQRGNPHSPIKPNNLAYIIYTSGSTGKPKGVQIAHSSVVNLLQAIATCPGLSRHDRMLAVTTISFDVSVPEIYSPLTVGGCVVIASREATKDPAQLIELLTKQGATVMSATPATWRMLLEAGWEGSKALKIICTGESLSRELGNKLLAKGTSLWNLYGPTEITVWATIYQVNRGEGAIAIGRPIANTQTYILDANHEPVAIGEPGELHIGGLGVARGYLNRRELTAEKFIPNPFSQDSNSRLYRTGDLTRYRTDGNIEYLGRIDHQVKIRGYRIELGEIEATLCQHPKVSSAVVVAREDVTNQKRLVGYIVPHTADNSSETQDVAKETEKWEKIWDEAYIQPDEAQDGSFHIGGWNDSYTGKDLDPEQVREWVEHTVERIKALNPQRLLEIGCGTGLLLFRIAPQCQHYYATDLSGEAIRYLERQIGDSKLASSVTLRQSPADGLAEIVNEPFDTAISNSVIQFFPSIDYLVQVIETAVELVEPGGQIFLGDILSLPLLEAFHTSVQ
ncbi:MAG: amino acid adenylation domain-containing protein, partial [Symploca sp. SIO3E6]|nr:amino acid adenylation domain-containing protein [Caldora sp. SIO3E6]